MANTNNRSCSRSGLFLIELIVAILFFSLASAVCIQLFVKAYLVSTHSSDLSMALNQAQSTVECFKSSDGSLQDIKSLLSAQESKTPNELLLYYDDNWNPVKQDGVYQLTLTLEGTGTKTATVTIYKNGNRLEELYQIKTKKYLPQ